MRRTFSTGPRSAARVQLAVGVRSGTAFAEAVVRVVVDSAFAVDGHHVAAARVHVLAAFEHYGAHVQLYEFEGREESGRGSDDDGLRSGGDVGICDGLHGVRRGVVAVDVDYDRQIDYHAALTGVNRAAPYAQVGYPRGDDAELGGTFFLQEFGSCCDFRGGAHGLRSLSCRLFDSGESAEGCFFI